MTILIDSREPWHIQKLGTVTRLPAGDVWIQLENGLVIIERKTTNDFLESIKDGRLFNQVVEMRQISEWCYVAIEGVFTPISEDMVNIGHSELRNWRFSAIEGAKLSIQELGCGVIHYTDVDQLIKQMTERSKNAVKIPPRRNTYVFSPQEATLATLPGIGSKKSTEYMSIFNGRLCLAITALCAPHDGTIPGWGKKSRDSLIEYLGGEIELKGE